MSSNRLSNSLRPVLALLLSFTCSGPLVQAQDLSISSEKPTGNLIIRPYKPAIIPPVHLQNGSRLQGLIRGGKLYLTVQDAIALALENNIDLESDRYNALIDQWSVLRYEAGGSLPGVPSGSSQASSVTSGQGVSGSQAAAGVTNGNANATSGNAVGATISQVGTVIPTLDPVLQSTISFSHRSLPQPEIVQSAVTNLIQNTRIYNVSLAQGLITGGNVSITYKDQYLNENAPTDLLNPSSATTLSIAFRHNLLQGFGTKLNSRSITVAKANLGVNDLYFKTEVINVVANVLDLYYGLVADYEDARAKNSALEVARTFFENNKKQVAIGTMAPLDVTTAESQVASSEQANVQSQAALEQQQVNLKNILSRNGLADPLMRDVQVIPLDRIVVPDRDDLPPIKDLVANARANRADIQADRLNLINSQTNAINTQNGILPTLSVQANASAQGLAGVTRYSQVRTGASKGTGIIPPGYVACPPSVGPPGSLCEVPDPYFVGGIGTALGQSIRRNFPTQNVGAYIAPTIHNRVSIADQVIDQLSIKQTELQHAKDLNQVSVDVSNQVVGLQQARIRYQAALHNRILEEQLLAAEQKKFALGASTTYNVVQQQRDLVNAQSSEVAALVTYSSARISLDQTLGTTLESNHVKIREAQEGRVQRPSTLPDNLPSTGN